MSFLNTSSPKSDNLLLNYFKNYRRTITGIRVRNYHKRLEDRHIVKDSPVKEIEWFEEKDKGCLVYVEGKREPMRGLMYHDDFVASMIWKKALALFLKFIWGNEEFEKEGKKNIFELIFILIGVIKMYPFYIKFLHHALYDNIYENTDKYSQPIRELSRVFPAGMEKERDIICFFSESDHAYRYRLQDVLTELDQKAFSRNPGKETKRLLDILTEREPVEGTMRAKWRALKKVITLIFIYLLILKPKLYRAIKVMVDEINLDETKFSKEDLYWINEQNSFNFRGLSYEVRKTMNK